MSSQNLCDALTSAILSKNVNALENLVNQGADLNMTLSAGLMPLVLAANNSDLDTCEALLQLGAKLEGNTGMTAITTRETPLCVAVRAALIQAVDTLIILGSNVNATVDLCNERLTADPFHLHPGSTVLHLAVFRHNLPIVRRLVEAGADINRADCSGNTALHLACLDPSDDTEMVRYMLSLNRGTRAACRRADIDARNCLDQTPLMLAASRNADVTRLLLKERPLPIIEMQDKNRRTALHYAAESGIEETVLMLLRAGSKVDGAYMPPNGRSVTPLHVAVRAGNTSICQILLDFGADPTILTVTGDTVLHQAASCSCWKDPVNLLNDFVDKGISIEVRNSGGYTALVVAANSGNMTVLKFLIDLDAQLNVPGFNGMTALVLSIIGHHRDVSKLLLVEGANPNSGCLRVPKPTHWVKLREQMDVFRLLLQTSASFARMHVDDCARMYGHAAITNGHMSVTSVHSDPLIQEMIDILSAPRSLRDCCRLTIRSAVVRHRRGAAISRSVLRLPLPRSLLDYLSYVDEISEQALSSDGSDDDALISSISEL